jgi:hypothetical protein
MVRLVIVYPQKRCMEHHITIDLTIRSKSADNDR